MIRHVCVPDDGAGGRADVFLATALELSRAYVQKLFSGGRVSLEGRPLKPGYRLKRGEILAVVLPPPEPSEVAPENIPLTVLYEDEDLAIVNKSRGMVVHPGSGVATGTLVNALLFHYQGRLSSIGGTERPGIVHRLDKDTCGLMVVARTDLAHQGISAQFARAQVRKEYRTLVVGLMPLDKISVDKPVGRHPTERKRMAVVPGGRRALTHFEVIQRGTEHTYVRALPRTGRTHRIRVHLKWLGFPIVGDPVYGKPGPWLQGQFLHAFRLAFEHPRDGRPLQFEAPLPAELREVLSRAGIEE